MHSPLSTLVQYAKKEGLSNALKVVESRLSRIVAQGVAFPGWIAFRLRTMGHVYKGPLATEATSPADKEKALARLLSKIPGGSFLEIGIGEFPSSSRMRLMHQQKIRYTALDFAQVCERHERELRAKQVPLDHTRYIGNTTGTYSWSLFEMVEAGEQFDVIYLDGHHTFYIDLPAMILADRLLSPGGVLILDDALWDLNYLVRNMRRSLAQWTFYHQIYRLSEYTETQRARPHIGMIATTLLLNDGRYMKEESGTANDWWVLRKN